MNAFTVVGYDHRGVLRDLGSTESLVLAYRITAEAEEFGYTQVAIEEHIGGKPTLLPFPGNDDPRAA